MTENGTSAEQEYRAVLDVYEMLAGWETALSEAVLSLWTNFDSMNSSFGVTVGAVRETAVSIMAQHFGQERLTATTLSAVQCIKIREAQHEEIAELIESCARAAMKVIGDCGVFLGSPEFSPESFRDARSTLGDHLAELVRELRRLNARIAKVRDDVAWQWDPLGMKRRP